MRPRNRVLASIQGRYFLLFSETPNQKNKHSKTYTSKFSAITWQKGSLLNNTINKIFKNVYDILLYKDNSFMTNRRQPFILNILLALSTWTILQHTFGQSSASYIRCLSPKDTQYLHNLTKFCLHMMKRSLRIFKCCLTMLFDIC